MALPPTPATRSGARRSAASPRRAAARLSSPTWPAAIAVLACCGLTACGTVAAPGAGTTDTVTVQPSSASPSGGATPTTSSTGQAASGLHTCSASALKGSLGTSQGAAGTLYTDVMLTNTSSSPCSLYGYPGVSFVAAPGGSEIGAAANRNPVSPAQLIKVAPGAQVNFLMGLTDVGVYPVSQCHPTSVSWLRIYPPGAYDSLYVQYAAQTCAATSLVVLRVSTVRAGLTGVGA